MVFDWVEGDELEGEVGVEGGVGVGGLGSAWGGGDLRAGGGGGRSAVGIIDYNGKEVGSGLSGVAFDCLKECFLALAVHFVPDRHLLVFLYDLVCPHNLHGCSCTFFCSSRERLAKNLRW